MAEQAPAASFSLWTYNIRKGKGPWGNRAGWVEPVAAALAAFGPDIVLCQEVYHGRTQRLQQSQVMAEGLHLVPYYMANARRRHGHWGNATLTRHRVTALRRWDISTNPIERRGALYTRLLIGTQPLHIFNVHLGLSQKQRLIQVRKLAHLMALACPAQEPVIIAGDFNDWNGRIDQEMTKTLGLTNALAHLQGAAARTFHAQRPLFNLDRIYLRHVRVAGSERLAGPPWSTLSDHLPLSARLSLRSV
jgi:endonuclease/exonuclease/phosphatase family metal-dependent hydrolase